MTRQSKNWYHRIYIFRWLLLLDILGILVLGYIITNSTPEIYGYLQAIGVIIGILFLFIAVNNRKNFEDIVHFVDTNSNFQSIIVIIFILELILLLRLPETVYFSRKTDEPQTPASLVHNTSILSTSGVSATVPLLTVSDPSTAKPITPIVEATRILSKTITITISSQSDTIYLRSSNVILEAEDMEIAGFQNLETIYIPKNVRVKLEITGYNNTIYIESVLREYVVISKSSGQYNRVIIQ